MSTNGSAHKPRSGLVAALDVGSTKVCCLIAKPQVDRGAYGGKGPRVVGVGHNASQGIRGGTVVDLEAAEASIRAAVEKAEQMAGENIQGVTVNLAGGRPHSKLLHYEVSIAGHEITEADLRRVLDPQAFLGERPKNQEVVHAIPVGYSVDGNKGVRDPRGMYGNRLGVNVHVVSAATGPVRNLRTGIERCHLELDNLVISPYAAALSALVSDETQLGVTLIDIGGGTTSVAVFFDGELVHTDVVPVGGQHVTSDIARGLSTPLKQAERLKTLYGSCLPSSTDDREVIQVPLVGEDADHGMAQVPRSMVVGIIRPRIEETFELVRQRLAKAGFDKVAGRRVVLTGGASQLTGVAEFAGRLLDRQVRIARPKPIDGLPEAVAGPAFSASAGLLQYACDNPRETAHVYRPHEREPGRFGRIGQWLKENF